MFLRPGFLPLQVNILIQEYCVYFELPRIYGPIQILRNS